MPKNRIRPQRQLTVESLESRCLLSASSLDTNDREVDTSSGLKAWVASATDITAPRVVSVRVSSEAWQGSYLDHIDPAQRSGFPMSALARQHASLPWTNIDQIQIQFSEDVGATFDSSMVKISGTRITDYQSLYSVSYNENSFVATIQFDEPLSADKLAIGIRDTLSDAAGNQLDGEWLDGGSQTTSGDGIAGGNFYYRIHVLAGDLSGDGVVLGNDVTAGVLARSKSVGDDGYYPLSDLDGSGNTTPEEIKMLVSLRGTWLSTGEPQLPSFAITPQNPLDVAQPDEQPPVDAQPKNDQPPASAEPLVSDEPPSHGSIASTKATGPTTCRGLELESQPILELFSDIQLPAVDFIVYGPLLPDEYRLRFLTFNASRG
ncbi:MAG: hypothetical protein KDA72_03815 [Planctomycetales bacterium]|nr:hypothetical protein [Planctomycetales bacterium]